MKKRTIHIKEQHELGNEINEMISGSNIVWSKPKEEIWLDLQEKLNNKKYLPQKNKIVYLQFKKLAVAATILILFGIPALFYFYTKSVDNVLTENLDISLPDNSLVTVYPNTDLSYKPLIWKIARSTNLNGEAFFQVQKGKKFEVVSERAKTIVLGTQFIVYSRNNDYNVTCISGKVKVVENEHQNEVILTAGMKAILLPDGTFEIHRPTDVPNNNSDKIQSQTVEEKLNNLLTPIPAKAEDKQPNQKNEIDTKSNNKDIPKLETDKPDDNKNPLNAQNEAKEDVSRKEQMSKDDQKQAAEDNRVKEKEQPANNIDNPSSVNPTAKGPSDEIGQKQVEFKNSLTPDQLKILNDTQMPKAERQKAFMNSLSPEQKNLYKEVIKEKAQQVQNKKQNPTTDDDSKENRKQQNREQNRENVGNEVQRQNKEKGNPNVGNPNLGNENKQGGQNSKGN